MDWCDNCAFRLYNTKYHNLQGIGNPWNGKCIVVPNVDYDAYRKGSLDFSSQVDIVSDALSSTGELTQSVYIVPLIRCNETISCPLDNISYNKCLHWFAEDVRKYDFRDILLLGSAGRRFLSCDIESYLNTIICSRNNRRYAVNYSPLIYYIDSNKFEIYKQNLIKWYDAVYNQNYSNYEIKVL